MWMSINHTDRLWHRQEEGIKNLCCKCSLPLQMALTQGPHWQYNSLAKCSSGTPALRPLDQLQTEPQLPPLGWHYEPSSPELPFTLKATVGKCRNPRHHKLLGWKGLLPGQEQHSSFLFSLSVRSGQFYLQFQSFLSALKFSYKYERWVDLFS